MSRLSLLLHESEATSVNNNDNLRVQWDLSGFYPIAFELCNVTLFFFEVICLE